MSTVKDNKAGEKAALMVLTLNDFDANSNVPDPLKHNLCWNSEDLKEGGKGIRMHANCTRYTSITPFQYLALWVPVWCWVGVCEIEVYESAKISFLILILVYFTVLKKMLFSIFRTLNKWNQFYHTSNYSSYVSSTTYQPV